MELHAPPAKRIKLPRQAVLRNRLMALHLNPHLKYNGQKIPVGAHQPAMLKKLTLKAIL